MTITAILELGDGRAVAGTLDNQKLTDFVAAKEHTRGNGEILEGYVLKKPAQVVFVEDAVRNAAGDYLTADGRWVTQGEAKTLGSSKLKIVRVMKCIPFDCEQLVVGFHKISMARDLSVSERKEYTNAIAPIPGTTNSVLV